VIDEKRERQTLGLRVLSPPMVHSILEFLNLTPNDLGNGAPETSVECIESTEENVPPLCLVSQRTCIPIEHHINKKKIPRNLRFVGCVPVIVCILSLTHVRNNILEGEHGGALEPRNFRLGRLVTALQNGCYVGYSHLHFSSIDGRDKNVRLVAVITEVLIKLSDQALVCSGGDGLEQPLQTLILQLLNRPTSCRIIGELLFDGKGVIQ
jgi:hypothetical protein